MRVAEIELREVARQMGLGDVVERPGDPTLEDRILKNATASGLDVDSITMFHPLGPAAVVVASTNDVSQLVHHEALSDIFGQLSDYDGVLLIVSDPTDSRNAPTDPRHTPDNKRKGTTFIFQDND